MKWYQEKGDMSDVVISSRVRLARNIDRLPFPGRLDRASSEEVVKTVENALKASGKPFQYIDISAQDGTKRAYMLEDHLVSSEFCEDSPLFRVLVTDPEEHIAIMINEEDHLRIQAIEPGFALEKAYERADQADEIIARGTNYAFDEKFGYLTSCPTNLGTGMRASVMLHLPAICACGYLKSLLDLMTKIGLTVRGLFGEGSEAKGDMYQISNQVTLGISEKDTIEKLCSAVLQIIAKERELRKGMCSDDNIGLRDQLWRSYGILRYARTLDTAEATKLISNLRFATECGVIPECREKNLTKLFVEVMPAHITTKFGARDTKERDRYRADYVRSELEKDSSVNG